MMALACATAILALPNPESPADSTYLRRAADWRIGPVVYQVMIDRFAPPADLAAKRRILTAPRRVRPWSQTPTAGQRDAEQGLWTHELDFWGGDLASLRGRLGHLQDLGADVLYLQPIHDAYTNHKYDAIDYRRLSPEIGTREDLRALVGDLRSRNLRLVLDGVFNHMGRRSTWFQAALADEKSPYRNWFRIGPQFEGGYQKWFGVGNLAVLNLEDPSLRRELWEGPDSVVADYLRDGVDGWRLDVAFELGPDYLTGLTEAAHAARPGSLVVGEINGYPADWFPAVDGVFNFFGPAVARDLASGKLDGGRAGRLLDDLVADAGIENLLRSWLIVDNHDTPRFANQVPDPAVRAFVRALQFSLPGAPVVYYGSELGMTGAGDPMNRAPMRWDLVKPTNPDLADTRRLIAVRRTLPALRVGDFRAMRTDRLLAFLRTTDRTREAVLVAANPTDQPVKETFAVRWGRLMSWAQLEDALAPDYRVRVVNGLAEVEVPPRGVRWLRVVTEPIQGHDPTERVP